MYEVCKEKGSYLIVICAKNRVDFVSTLRKNYVATKWKKCILELKQIESWPLPSMPGRFDTEIESICKSMELKGVYREIWRS